MRGIWSAADEFIVRKLYADTPTAELAELVGRTVTQVHSKAKRLGLKKSAKYLASPAACRLRRGDNVGKAYRFPKGHVPANKGTRRPGWSAGNMAKTQFKKGRPAPAAHNYKPIGTEKIDPKRKVLMRKVTDDPAIFPVKRWRHVHVIAWSAANGPVPSGHIVIFRRGMKTFVATEITVDRLELVTLAENMRRNTIHNLPESIKTTVRALGYLRRRINRESQHEKQD